MVSIGIISGSRRIGKSGGHVWRSCGYHIGWSVLVLVVAVVGLGIRAVTFGNPTVTFGNLTVTLGVSALTILGG